MGSFTTGTSSGSHTDSDLRSGEPFVFVPSTNDGIYSVNPTFTISGSVISWDFNRGFEEGRSNASVTAIYGIYSSG